MSEIVWESDAQSSGFTIMSNGTVWPDDWPGTLVEAQFTSARGDGADLDRDPDMVPSGPGRVTFTPLVRTVGYDGEHGKRIVSLHPFEAVVGDDGYLYTPDEYGGPGIRGIVLPSNNSAVVDEHDWTWRVTFDIPDTTIRTTHIPTPRDHSVDIKDYLDSDANYGVRVVVDRVAARETLTARDETIAARDEVLPARDETLTARDETLAHGITVDTSVGTRVYVGNTMIHGDTGWREIGSYIPQDIRSKSSDGTFRVYIKRENSTVTLSIDYLRLSESLPSITTLLNLPPGFEPERPVRLGSGSTYELQSAIYTSGNELITRDGVNSGLRRFYASWSAANSWPLALPGAPA